VGTAERLRTEESRHERLHEAETETSPPREQGRDMAELAAADHRPQGGPAPASAPRHPLRPIPLASKGMRDALSAAVERSGKLDPLIVAPRRPKRSRTRYRAKRAAARRVPG
jgi:hypothetical protein